MGWHTRGTCSRKSDWPVTLTLHPLSKELTASTLHIAIPTKVGLLQTNEMGRVHAQLHFRWSVFSNWKIFWLMSNSLLKFTQSMVSPMFMGTSLHIMDFLAFLRIGQSHRGMIFWCLFVLTYRVSLSSSHENVSFSRGFSRIHKDAVDVESKLRLQSQSALNCHAIFSRKVRFPLWEANVHSYQDDSGIWTMRMLSDVLSSRSTAAGPPRSHSDIRWTPRMSPLGSRTHSLIWQFSCPKYACNSASPTFPARRKGLTTSGQSSVLPFGYQNI